MNDLKTACPKCGRQEHSTLHYDGPKPYAVDEAGTIPAKCIQCGWKGRIYVRAEFGLTKPVACTKEQPWDRKTLPIIHVDGDFVGDTDALKCPNCGHIWSLGPDV